VLIINNVYAYVEGSKVSTTYLSSTNKFKYSNITELVVFGDSLSAIQTNFEDMSYMRQYNPEGERWSIHLSDLNNMTLWNYSVTGACVDKDIVPRQYFSTTFREEYEYFLERMSAGRMFANNWNGNNTLFAFWLGTNDISNLNHTLFPQTAINQTLETIGDIFFTSVKGLYNTGGRNFLIFNVQSIDETPGVYTLPGTVYGVPTNFDADVHHFNEYIQKLSKEFTTKYTDTNIIIYNIMEEIRYIQEHYNDYGFISSTDFWAGKNLTEEAIPNYLWLDGLHSTFKANSIFAEDINKYLISIENKDEEENNENKDEEGNNEN
jgi:phospholipase/lecithinase/hemolysin